jgi:hypothetical protein
MFWRVVSSLGVLFWAVMTGLLIRDTYFPEASRFSEVPPRMVIDLFLAHPDFGKSLDVFHEKERVGHASVSIRRETEPDARPSVHELRVTGQLEGEALGIRDHALTYHLDSEIEDTTQWRRVTLLLHWSTNAGVGADDDVRVHFSWKAGQQRPTLEVRRGSEIIMDMDSALASIPGLTAATILPVLGSGTGAPPARIKAREGVIELAGRERKCYFLEMTFLETHNARLIFTEAGELARVDLPQGWRMLEPNIHEIGDEIAQ